MTSPTTTINVTTQKADNVLELQALLNGITTLLPKVDSFLLSRQTVSRADLLAQVQKRLDAALATKNARIALHNAVEAERNAQTVFKPLRSALRAYLVSVFSANAPELQQFGFVQSRRPKKTVAPKAAAVTKAKATRQARGTKGKKQKATIHGTSAAGSAAGSAASSGTATQTLRPMLQLRTRTRGPPTRPGRSRPSR